MKAKPKKKVKKHPLSPPHSESIHHHLFYLLDNMPDGFFSLDRQWRYTYVNHAFEMYEAIKREEVLGKKMWEVFPRVREKNYFKKYQEAMASGQQTEFAELLDHKWYEVRVFPDRHGISVFYRDISDRKLFDERKDEFIRMASHELKTPLTSLRLYTDMLGEKISDSEASIYLSQIRSQADRLNELVTNMLDLSRIQLGKLSFKQKPVDLVKVAREALAPLQAASASHKILVNLKAKRAPVLGDPYRLSQLVTNLVDNAIKYSPAQDHVIVTLEREGSRVKFSVQDFGVGIDPAYKGRIFERFYQATGAQGRAFPGLGIGLYIAKVIADKHGGRLEVESTLGKGSTFTLSLPLLKNQKGKK